MPVPLARKLASRRCTAATWCLLGPNALTHACPAAPADNVLNSPRCMLELEAAARHHVPVVFVVKEGARWGDANGNMLSFPPAQTIRALKPDVQKIFALKPVHHRWGARGCSGAAAGRGRRLLMPAAAAAWVLTAGVTCTSPSCSRAAPFLPPCAQRGALRPLCQPALTPPQAVYGHQASAALTRDCATTRAKRAAPALSAQAVTRHHARGRRGGGWC